MNLIFKPFFTVKPTYNHVFGSMIKTKKCSRCEKIKSVDDFYNTGRTKIEKFGKCKFCLSEEYIENRENKIKAVKANRDANLELHRQRDRQRYLNPVRRAQLKAGCKKHYENNKEIISKQSKERRLLDRDYAKHKDLMGSYKIGLKEYNEMLFSQKNVCAICFCAESKIVNGRLKHLAVDHNHVTKKNRGLLCTKCNIGLGQFMHNQKFLDNAIKYLKKHSQDYNK